MYVCNCNGIREKEVLAVVEAGLDQWECILAYFQCKPRCGKCEQEINLMIEENSGRVL